MRKTARSLKSGIKKNTVSRTSGGKHNESTDIDTVMQMNIDKLKARYPEGFTVENSLHRKVGDI